MASNQGVVKLTGDNLIFDRTKFSALSQAVFVMIVITWHTGAHPHLELKTRPRFCPVSLSLFII